MEQITDWLMVIITAIYVMATIVICRSNQESAKAAREAVEESKKQFNKSLELQKQHNYDSVRPFVGVDYHFSGNGDYLNGTISILNHGLGPAIIKSLIFQNDDGEEYKLNNRNCSFLDFVNLRVSEVNENLQTKDIFNQFYSKPLNFAENDYYCLSSNESITLLHFETRNTQESIIVSKLFQGSSFKLYYTDIYNSNEWVIIKSLTDIQESWNYLYK